MVAAVSPAPAPIRLGKDWRVIWSARALAFYGTSGGLRGQKSARSLEIIADLIGVKVEHLHGPMNQVNPRAGKAAFSAVLLLCPPDCVRHLNYFAVAHVLEKMPGADQIRCAQLLNEWTHHGSR